MSGADFGTFILGLVVVAILVAITVWLLHWLYLRSSKERSFVRTGLGGQRVVLDGGVLGNVPPSTLVDCTQPEPSLIREGAIPRAELRRAVGRFAP
jgi:hypothetical protein